MEKLTQRLYEQILSYPVVDCHEHMLGPAYIEPPREAISFLVGNYTALDLTSAAFGFPPQQLIKFGDPQIKTEVKWPLFEKLWQASEFTAYTWVSKRVLKQYFGFTEMNLSTLQAVNERLAEADFWDYPAVLKSAGIQAALTDVLGWLQTGLEGFLDGRVTFPDYIRPVISLPDFHNAPFNQEKIEKTANTAKVSILNLEDYLEAAFSLFKQCKDLGCVAMKDQSAYSRPINFAPASKPDAEKLFQQVLVDKHRILGWPENKPLGDFLFQQFMQFAHELDLPVQLHTGHIAGTYRKVDTANAAQLTSLLESNKNVRFDLFHGNWPYLGDLLFLGKNYPNVFLDLCWLHIIDPLYAIQMLKSSVMTVPHSKIHAYGGDYSDAPHFSAAHLELARRNIAAALSDLIQMGWMEEEQALILAADWLYNNPNRFFKLGLPDFFPSI